LAGIGQLVVAFGGFGGVGRRRGGVFFAATTATDRTALDRTAPTTAKIAKREIQFFMIFCLPRHAESRAVYVAISRFARSARRGFFKSSLEFEMLPFFF
jgi:hypothetical protein